jgi:hypothetical protein
MSEIKKPIRDLLLPKSTSLRPRSLFDTSFTYEQAMASQKPDVGASLPPSPAPISKVSIKGSKTLACIPCVKNHVSAIAGILGESKRFIGGGIKDPKIIEAINIATKEITAAERGDLDPAKIASLPPKEKEVAEWAADQLRDLRHSIDHVSDKETLESAIVKADQINNEMISKFMDLLVG